MAGLLCSLKEELDVSLSSLPCNQIRAELPMGAEEMLHASEGRIGSFTRYSSPLMVLFYAERALTVGYRFKRGVFHQIFGERVEEPRLQVLFTNTDESSESFYRSYCIHVIGLRVDAFSTH